MRQFVHTWWPVAAVVVFTVTLVLEIPRKAPEKPQARSIEIAKA